MAGGPLNVASLNPKIDALLGLRKWDDFDADPDHVNLTYNFPVTASYYAADYFTEGGGADSPPIFDFATFGPVTASLEVAVDKIIASEFMAVAPLVYTKVDSAAVADTSIAMASLFGDPDDPAMMPPGGSAYYPAMVRRGGDAWFNIDQPRFDSVDIGDSAYWVVLHELGHSVGLKHGHANDRPGPTMDLLPTEENSFEFSVMTYLRYVGDPDPFTSDTQADSFPQTLMMHDIAAIQYMYGANFSHNSGNTVYTFSPTTGEMSVDGVGQGTPSGNRIFRTIWDGNGIDTYDLSNYTTDLEIDLAPGGWSNFHSNQLALLHIGDPMDVGDNIWARGNVFNALQFNADPRSLIENAIGGSGNDTIQGNSTNNVLTGGAGNDDLFGLGGFDTLVGGLGADLLDGGVNVDVASYEAASTGVIASLALGGMTGEAAGDTYVSVEGLIGSAFTDWLLGNAGANVLRGNGGADTLNGGGGNDRLEGGSGADALHGGPGFDYASYESSTTGLTARLSNPAFNTGNAFGDTYFGVEGLIGTAFDDTLIGDDNDNELRGGAGNDFLFGLGGKDRIEGGAGNDRLFGGAGNDTFVFTPGFGSDTISGWQDGRNQDVISFEGRQHLSIFDLTITYENGNATVSVTESRGDQIVILNVAANSIGADDFLFA